jgi:urea transport system permease protein
MNATPLIDGLFNGFSQGSIYILTALGLAISFGVMRVINMAHGEMLMLGAYTGFVMRDPAGLPRLISGLSKLLHLPLDRFVEKACALLHLPWDSRTGVEYNLPVAIAVSFVVVALAGFVLEKALIRFLYGRPLDTLLATWGVGLVLQQVVRLIFGPDIKSLGKPTLLQENFVLAGASIDYFRVFIVGFTGIALLLVFVGFFRTRLGLQVRAVTQNRAMASALGVRTRRVDSLTFAFGAGLAGVAGCIMGHQVNVTPDMGGDYIVFAFLVVILGGMGRLAGVVVSGLIVGLVYSLLIKLFDNSFEMLPRFPVWIAEVPQPMARVVVLLVVIGFIMVRPSGILALKERIYD